MPDITTAANDMPQMPWSAPTHTQHAEKPLGSARPVLLDRPWPYEPASCPTGFRVVAQRVAADVFVCPLCGLRTS